jgi:hypothetical protein
MRVNPYTWPQWLVLLAIVWLAGVGWSVQSSMDHAWGNIIGLIAGVVVTVLGVTLADRRFPGGRDGD